MTVMFKKAVRQSIPLLIGLAGGTGSGKTYSALEMARGIAAGQKFAVIDTENGRALHYADSFDFDHAEIHAPFRPQAYAEAITAADAAGYSVIVVDSTSHEWAGDGGCLDWQEELMRGEESRRLMSWIEPKRSHKRFVTRLLQVKAHVILCFRAEPKVEMVKDENNRWQFIPKPSLTGLDGWIPVSEKMLPYELTSSFLLMADKPGVPLPIKLQEQHRPYVPLDRPLTADVGAALADWARGGSAVASTAADLAALEAELVGLAEQLGGEQKRAAVSGAITRRRGHGDDATFAVWLRSQIERAREALPVVA